MNQQLNNKKILVTAPWEITTVEENFEHCIDNPNEIIIRNRYSHISAGTELACIEGLEGWFVIPATPGYTAVGEILEMGDGVTCFEKGDMVYTFGPHAAFFKIDITDRWHGICVKLPKGLSPDIAAFTHMGGIAMTALRASSIELGDLVVVSGLGTIGNMAAQFAQLQGATVVATDINQSRIEIAGKCGIHQTINSSRQKFPQELLAITGKEKADCWIDATGQPAVIEDAFNYIVPNGELILLGSPRTSYETNLTKTLQKIHLLDNIKVKGALEFLYPTHQNEFNKHSIERNSSIIMNLAKSEKLAIRPFYTHKIKPEQAPEAYKGLRDKPDEYVGVVIDWD